LNDEAAELGRKVKIYCLIDRGFFGQKNWIEEEIQRGDFAFLTITFGMPHFQNPPIGRGKKGEKKEKRLQFEKSVSEASIGLLKGCRVFESLVDVTILPLIDDFITIAAGLANFSIKQNEN
jgi:hypothetical protein